jgi:hypothetical protein
LAGVQDGDLLVSFDITNMLPSINNQTGVERVQRKLYEYASNFDIQGVPKKTKTIEITNNNLIVRI